MVVAWRSGVALWGVARDSRTETAVFNNTGSAGARQIVLGPGDNKLFPRVGWWDECKLHGTRVADVQVAMV